MFSIFLRQFIICDVKNENGRTFLDRNLVDTMTHKLQIKIARSILFSQLTFILFYENKWPKMTQTQPNSQIIPI